MSFQFVKCQLTCDFFLHKSLYMSKFGQDNWHPLISYTSFWVSNVKNLQKLCQKYTHVWINSHRWILNGPTELSRGLTRQLKHLCSTYEKDGDQCNKSLVDNNIHTPRGMEDDNKCVRVRSSSLQGWFGSLGVGSSIQGRCLSLVRSLLLQFPA